MKEIIVGSNEAGQRLDKLLIKVLNQAPQGFLYKMLRKKNIKLNHKRAEGKEILKAGDTVQIYLSEETFEHFHEERYRKETSHLDDSARWQGKVLPADAVLYQDKNIMIINKPAGILSQKAKQTDDSINEQMIRYLLESGEIVEEQFQTFVPSVCNRLDRNTSGIILAGISFAGSQALSRMLKDRSLDKYYLALVSGYVVDSVEAAAYLQKDPVKNQVRVSSQPIEGGSYIETHYKPILQSRDYTLLEVKLITGKTHQIRAHLAYMGHPVLGDARYGDQKQNQEFRDHFHIQNQFLHAYRIVFPDLDGALSNLSGMECRAPLPGKYRAVLQKLWENEWMEQL